MKTYKYALVALTIGFLAGVAPAWGEDNVFAEGQNNYWKVDANWSLGHDPEADENAVIPITEQCVIHNAGGDAVAASIEVYGILTIEDEPTLTITVDSRIDGRVELQGTLDIDAATLEITGQADGVIRMERDTDQGGFASTIDGVGNVLTLADDVSLFGNGIVNVDLVNTEQVVAGGDPQVGQFEGDLDLNGDVSGTGRWEARYGTTLDVHGEASGSGDWEIKASGAGESDSNQIVINATSCVSGDVTVWEGDFIVKADFCTTGLLDLNSDQLSRVPQVVVYKGAFATFSYPGLACSCP